jgi:hypothetical protein
MLYCVQLPQIRWNTSIFLNKKSNKKKKESKEPCYSTHLPSTGNPLGLPWWCWGTDMPGPKKDWHGFDLKKKKKREKKEGRPSQRRRRCAERSWSANDWRKSTRNELFFLFFFWDERTLRVNSLSLLHIMAVHAPHRSVVALLKTLTPEHSQGVVFLRRQFCCARCILRLLQIRDTDVYRQPLTVRKCSHADKSGK